MTGFVFMRSSVLIECTQQSKCVTSNLPSMRPRKAFLTANCSAAESSVRKYRGTHGHQLEKKIEKKYNKIWENFYLLWSGEMQQQHHYLHWKKACEHLDASYYIYHGPSR